MATRRTIVCHPHSRLVVQPTLPFPTTLLLLSCFNVGRGKPTHNVSWNSPPIIYLQLSSFQISEQVSHLRLCRHENPGEKRRKKLWMSYFVFYLIEKAHFRYIALIELLVWS